ncbi:unnamed protein product [Polarella glacialis]|uniref:Uncharacterized protein n=1 Tax=Polarella glacialis TaxID=89957 RepID=A0A813HTB3_POLGL|nr:unnamed protein product [Polarella glacialis]
MTSLLPEGRRKPFLTTLQAATIIGDVSGAQTYHLRPEETRSQINLQRHFSMAAADRMADIVRQASFILKNAKGKTSRQLAEEFASVELLTAGEFEPVATVLVRSFDGSLQILDSPTTCKAEAARARKRLAMMVTLIGHLYLVKLVARRVIQRILIGLIPPGDDLPDEFRVLCSYTLLKVVGHALADVDASHLVAFIGKLVALTAKSSFGAPTRRLVDELREISTTSWQPKRVLTVRAEMVASHVEVSCTSMGGEQVCAFNMMASAKLPDLVAEVKSQILNPFDVLTLILETGALLPHDDETTIGDLLKDLQA